MFVLLLPGFSVQALSVNFPPWEMRIRLARPFLYSPLHTNALPPGPPLPNVIVVKSRVDQ